VAAVKPDLLQPGQKGELSFTLNLPKTRASLQKQITLQSNDPKAPRSLLTVKAEYLPLYEVVPPSWYLISVRHGQSTNLTARVIRTDGKKFEITKIKPTQTNSTSWLEAKVEPDLNWANATNSSVLVAVTIKAEGGPRYLSDSLNVYAEDGAQPAFSLPVSIRVLGDITLSRDNIFWPITNPTNVVASQPITVRSSLADKLIITNISCSLTNISLSTIQRDDKTFEIVAQLANVPEKTTNGLIRFDTNVPSQPKMAVPVTVAVIRPVATAPVPAALKH
jgi:hypothetical protein